MSYSEICVQIIIHTQTHTLEGSFQVHLCATDIYVHRPNKYLTKKYYPMNYEVWWQIDIQAGKGVRIRVAVCLVDQETNRLTVTSPAMMGIFGISIELQFGVWNNGKPCATFPHGKGGEAFL